MSHAYSARSHTLLDRIPKRTTEFDIFINSAGSAYGLTVFELPLFTAFLFYFIISVIAVFVFWWVWLSYLGHSADLQGAAVPIMTLLAFWALVGMLFGGHQWNTSRPQE